MKLIINALYHRSPKPLKQFIMHLRGFAWRIQIPKFLKKRTPPVSRSRPISIVIPSYNDLHLLKKCLNSLQKTITSDDEIIIVDDYCQPENSLKLLKLANNQIRVLLKQNRGGFAVTVNQGMREARHDIVLLNSDVIALPDWSEYLQEAAYSSPNIGIVSAKLLYPDGRIQYGGTFWARSFAPQWFAHRFAGAKFNYPPSTVRRYNWGAGGACLYITQEVFNAVGTLDESFWLGFEDVDYAMSTWNAGYISLFEPNSILFHLESATRGFHQGNRELRSMRTFWKKWDWLHLKREIDVENIRVVISPNEEQLWIEFASWISTELHCELLFVETEIPVSNQITLIMSESLLDSAWLVHVRTGLAIVLLREIPDSEDCRLAFLQPEFDYIAPSRKQSSKVERLLGMPTPSIVNPCIATRSSRQSSDTDTDLLILTNQLHEELAYELSSKYKNTVVKLQTPEDSILEILSELKPRVFLILVPWEDEIEVFAALDSGAIVIASQQDDFLHLLQNGLNSFTINANISSICERLDFLSNESSDYEQIVSNALETTARLRVISKNRLQSAIADSVTQRRN